MVFWLVLLAACSNTRFLTEEELLYTGRKDLEINATEEGVNTSRVKPMVRSTTSYKMNNALFGRRMLPPVGLWVHNYWEEEEGKRIKNWLYRSMEASPVLVSEIKPGLRAQKIESDLFDQGYFQARAWSVVDTSNRNPRKAMVSYYVEMGRPYRYNQIHFGSGEGSLDTLIDLHPFKDRIRAGDMYNLQDLTSVRNGLSRALQDQGFFYFAPEYIQLNADTTVGDRLLNLTISRQKDLPPEVLLHYRIDDIRVYIKHFADTVNTPEDSVKEGDLTIFSTGDYLRPEALQRAILLNEGEFYSYSSYEQTIARLNNMGVFSSVRITYGVSPENSQISLVDVRIELVMADIVSLEL
jgi:outer membrane translocation and assembly module TamA